ncbi:MAG TPA: hypothetical protein VG497_25025 [Kribbella sp.]|nr:hypothetical protein [Kribbella sp.]
MYAFINTASPSAPPGTGWFSFPWGPSVTAYTKPHLPFTNQVGLLKGRGLIIDDESEAEHP